jgi:DNA-binding NarL/FixJ family response regulator
MEPTYGPCPFGHDGTVKTKNVAKPANGTENAATPPVRVLIADSGPLQSQLLARALKSRRDFEVSAVAQRSTALDAFLQSNPADVALIAGSNPPDFGLLRWLRIAHPTVASVLLAGDDDRELVVNALRAGARGIFLFAHEPFRMLCKCINCVAKGEIWLNNAQMRYVADALSEVSTLRVVNSNGRLLLTPREEQVVALVADGLTNRLVAGELGLSEHTIKKYLLRIFDKVGISSRVELVLYAMAHGSKRPAEWMPGNA